MRTRIVVWAALAASLASCGASAPAIVPVSGRITYDGQPLANAEVNFLPIADQSRPEPGVGSRGRTDADGRYKLTVVAETPVPGAVIATHRVEISVPSGAIGSDDRQRGLMPRTIRIPDRYNEKSELKYEVLAGGTESADFNLTSR